MTTPPRKGDASSSIEVEPTTLASAIREQEALPITKDEAEQMARAIETSPDDATLLANTLAAVRFLVDRLERPLPDSERLGYARSLRPTDTSPSVAEPPHNFIPPEDADPVADALALLDWRRRISELYAEIRGHSDPREAWNLWQSARAELFRRHPQSPIPPSVRTRYVGPHVYPYDGAYRALAEVEPVEPNRLEIPTSTEDEMVLRRWGVAHFHLQQTDLALELYWLEGYAGGLFVPFADATSGHQTYGAGRYLLDSIKGADLGQEGTYLILDFNFAYQPSCSYDPRWMCPLAPAANRLTLPILAGERLAGG